MHLGTAILAGQRTGAGHLAGLECKGFLRLLGQFVQGVGRTDQDPGEDALHSGRHPMRIDRLPDRVTGLAGILCQVAFYIGRHLVHLFAGVISGLVQFLGGLFQGFIQGFLALLEQFGRALCQLFI